MIYKKKKGKFSSHSRCQQTFPAPRTNRKTPNHCQDDVEQRMQTRNSPPPTIPRLGRFIEQNTREDRYSVIETLRVAICLHPVATRHRVIPKMAHRGRRHPLYNHTDTDVAGAQPNHQYRHTSGGTHNTEAGLQHCCYMLARHSHSRANYPSHRHRLDPT
ncbi:hypothetical protein BDZ91DRAFT_502412 [Kalaharituber pfeilii]|nr:hypothetical protein BDZ91DRAFT_502412 [Kalaharituber pfeilii]